MVEGSMQCPECGLTIEDLRKTATIHCAYCPVAFRTELFLLQRRMGVHGEYAGRIPGKTCADQTDLHSALALALQSDDFERAVQIREQLRVIRNGGND